MKKCWGFYSNGKYQVGCNGSTIYVYDENNIELAKFRDIKYAYAGAFKPHTNIFVAKSTEGKLAVYDLDALKLVKKITITTIGAQDEGFAFSHSGDLFYNIEKPLSTTATQLTVYDGVNFTQMASYFADDKAMVLDAIEVYPNAVYLLGYMRGDDGVMNDAFISQFVDGNILAPRKIRKTASAIASHPQKWSNADCQYLSDCKRWELHGFTEKSGQWIETHPSEKPGITLKQIYEANA